MIREFRGKVKLIYIDPPFDSKAEYKKEIEYQGSSTESDRTAFEEKQYSDIWTNDEYLQFMLERLSLIRELLTPDGQVWVHCDARQSHNLRCVLSEIFGPERFLGEVAWQLGTGAKSRSFFSIQHNNLLVYARGDEWTFNHASPSLREPFAQTSTDMHFKKVDAKGRKYRVRTVNGKDYVYYADEGKLVGSVWTDISSMSANSPIMTETTGYPTQKPEKLLDRVINAATSPGDLVMDCFMGSGTTQAVAMKLGRRFIGADINRGALQTATARLLAAASGLDRDAPQLFDAEKKKVPLYTGFEVFTVNHYDVFRNPVEARDVLMQAHAVRPHGTPNPWHGETGDGQDTRQVYVMPVNCIATKADLQPIIENLRWKDLVEKYRETPRRPVLRATLLCMGHEPDLSANLVKEVRDGVGQQGCVVDIHVEDVLRGKANLQFKKESDGKVTARKGKLRIETFYPMNLLQKLSFDREHVDDWRKLVASVMIDFNYDGAVLRPTVVEVAKNDAIAGVYDIPEGAGTICVKITDLLSDSWLTTIEVNDD